MARNRKQIYENMIRKYGRLRTWGGLATAIFWYPPFWCLVKMAPLFQAIGRFGDWLEYRA